jgi:hypothetical protein
MADRIDGLGATQGLVIPALAAKGKQGFTSGINS